MDEAIFPFIIISGVVAFFVGIVLVHVIRHRHFVKVRRPRMIEHLKHRYPSERIESFLIKMNITESDRETVADIRNAIGRWAKFPVSHIHGATRMADLASLRFNKNEFYILREMIEDDLSTAFSDGEIEKIERVDQLVDFVLSLEKE